METNIKQRIAAGALALSLLGGTGVGVAAQQNQGAAGGLVGVLVGVQANDVVDVAIVDSFNNLRALNNFLNNSPILSQNDIDISDIRVVSVDDIVVNVEDNTIVVAGNVIDLDVLNISVEDIVDDIVAIVVVDDTDFVIVV